MQQGPNDTRKAESLPNDEGAGLLWTGLVELTNLLGLSTTFVGIGSCYINELKVCYGDTYSQNVISDIMIPTTMTNLIYQNCQKKCHFRLTSQILNSPDFGIMISLKNSAGTVKSRKLRVTDFRFNVPPSCQINNLLINMRCSQTNAVATIINVEYIRIIVNYDMWDDNIINYIGGGF